MEWNIQNIYLITILSLKIEIKVDLVIKYTLKIELTILTTYYTKA